MYGKQVQQTKLMQALANAILKQSKQSRTALTRTKNCQSGFGLTWMFVHK